MSDKNKLGFILTLYEEVTFYSILKKKKSMTVGSIPNAESYQTSYVAPVVSYRPLLLN